MKNAFLFSYSTCAVNKMQIDANAEFKVSINPRLKFIPKENRRWHSDSVLSLQRFFHLFYFLLTKIFKKKKKKKKIKRNWNLQHELHVFEGENYSLQKLWFLFRFFSHSLQEKFVDSFPPHFNRSNRKRKNLKEENNGKPLNRIQLNEAKFMFPHCKISGKWFWFDFLIETKVLIRLSDTQVHLCKMNSEFLWIFMKPDTENKFISNVLFFNQINY